jgi:hypothetical protein
MKKTLMEFTKDNLWMASVKDMAHSNGIMANLLKDNGKMELKMDMEFGNLPKGIFMKDSGNWIDNMVKELINIVWVLIEDISLIFLRMGTGNKFFLMEINMLELTNKENHMGKENINGLMEVIMKEIL